ncbi:MAG TPA: NAD(P)-binding domain-containing protein, partial [Candidatus Micrarchaeota archaeon]|nr:NAD(P)-binding domain-containing protein [Candidatus Micrarchaeota archaeon]
MIGIIGAGKLGSAIATRLGASRGFRGRVIAAGKDKEKLSRLESGGIAIAASAQEAIRKSEAAILCVKPKDMDALLEAIGGECKGKLVVSVAAGVSIAYLEKKLPGARVARCMPNLAAAIGMSETAVSLSKSATEKDRKTIAAIFGLLGNCHYMEEAKLTAWVGLSGSYPAYVALCIEAAAQAAQDEGFGREEALQLACRVTMASSKLLLDTGEEPMEL